jgi:hypothetical protein
MIVPTAEEFLKKYLGDTYKGNAPIEHYMIEFAKLHLKAQEEAILNKAKTIEICYGNTGSEYCDIIVDKKSIINAYPIENIN